MRQSAIESYWTPCNSPFSDTHPPNLSLFYSFVLDPGKSIFVRLPSSSPCHDCAKSANIPCRKCFSEGGVGGRGHETRGSNTNPNTLKNGKFLEKIDTSDQYLIEVQRCSVVSDISLGAFAHLLSLLGRIVSKSQSQRSLFKSSSLAQCNVQASVIDASCLPKDWPLAISIVCKLIINSAHSLLRHGDKENINIR